jgi:thymidylate synthase (FAD)
MNCDYIEHMGSDLLVANVARKSFGTGYTEFRTIAEGPRTPRGRSDEQLIYDLAADGHWLPFRHPHVTLSCSAAVPIARQLGKHQVGMEWSEISRRYKTTGIGFEQLNGTWRSDVKDRRQGSGDLLPADIQHELSAIQLSNIKRSIEQYEHALELGAAPEQARYLLPQSMLIEYTWTGSLLAWAHLYRQRTHKDAQKEVRDFAEAMSAVIRPLFPVSWKALVD